MLYEYECEICDKVTTEARKVADRFDAPACPACGQATKLKVTGGWLAPVTRAGTGSSGLAKRGRAQALR